VANIEPGGTVKIKITYFERLAYADGATSGSSRWSWGAVHPGRAGAGGEQADHDHDHAYDYDCDHDHDHDHEWGGDGGGDGEGAGRGSDHAAGATAGERSGHDIGLTVTVDAGLPIQKLESVAHQVTTEELPARSAS